MKKVTINLYEFNELSEDAKQKAIQEHFIFMCSVLEDDENEDDITDECIIENIEANEYLFYSDGDLADCVTYCGKHEKAGITELKIGNDIYTI